MSPTARRTDAIAGALLGTAVGDALGLPREGLGPGRARRLFGDPPLQHRFLLGRGMISDDTEHACFVGQALLAAPDDADAFARSLGWRLRGWLLGLPGGVGFGTLRAVLKLWLGFPPGSSGVRSAGNGPAMRAPLLGACLPESQLRAYVRASTRVTHTDPRAEEGALAIALAAQAGSHAGGAVSEPAAVLETIRAAVTGEELLAHVTTVAEHLTRGATAPELAAAIGCERGVTGYINHTVPAVLFCWLRWPDDYRAALEAVIQLGGDADTTGAILGGLSGATLGASAIPTALVDGLLEYPRSAAWMRELAERLAVRFPGEGPGDAQATLALGWPAIPLRNLLFITVVLLHGFRRLLPPYGGRPRDC